LQPIINTPRSKIVSITERGIGLRKDNPKQMRLLPFAPDPADPV
jgi:hypothetical protein